MVYGPTGITNIDIESGEQQVHWYGSNKLVFPDFQLYGCLLTIVSIHCIPIFTGTDTRNIYRWKPWWWHGDGVTHATPPN